MRAVRPAGAAVGIWERHLLRARIYRQRPLPAPGGGSSLCKRHVETLRATAGGAGGDRGIRAGFYLCFFGIHVLTPAVIELLGRGAATLSAALAELARHEQYLAVKETGRRYDIGARYGLLTAQVALALNGQDRGQVLSNLLELLADREMARE